MPELIDKEKLLKAIDHEKFMANTGYPQMHYRLKDCINHIKRFPAETDTVPLEVLKQVQWERDCLESVIEEMKNEHADDAKEAEQNQYYCFEDMCDWKDKPPCEICKESFLHGHAAGIAMRRMHYMMLNASQLKDRVKVVRCGECIYRTEETQFTREGFCNRVSGSFYAVKKDDFCSYGKKKDAEEHK